MKLVDTKEIICELDKGIGKGPLTLFIGCCECNAQFELNKDVVAVALMTNTSLIEFIRYVQSSKCSHCGKQNA